MYLCGGTVGFELHIAMDVWCIVASTHVPLLPAYDTNVFQLLEWDASARWFLRLRATSWVGHVAVQPFVHLHVWGTLFTSLNAEMHDINCAHDEWLAECGYSSD